jgi:hypothetical protein
MAGLHCTQTSPSRCTSSFSSRGAPRWGEAGGGRGQYFFDYTGSEDKEDKSMMLAPYRFWQPVTSPTYTGWRFPLPSVSCLYYDLGCTKAANDTQKPVEGEHEDIDLLRVSEFQ